MLVDRGSGEDIFFLRNSIFLKVIIARFFFFHLHIN